MEGNASILPKIVSGPEKEKGEMTTYKDIFETNVGKRSVFIYSRSNVSSTDSRVEGYFLSNRGCLGDM